GAMAHAAPILGGVAGRTTKGALLEALVTTLASEDDGDRLAPLLRQGAEHVGRVEAAHRQGRAHAEAGPDRPEMPPAAEPDPRWTERLRQFHLLGRGAHAAGDPFGTLPLWPAILHGALGPERIWHDYPLYVPAAGQDLHGAPVPLGDRLHQALGAMSEAGERHELIEGHVPRAVRAFARCVEERKRSTVPFASIRDEALVRFADEFEVSEAAREELRGQVRAWRRHLPDHGTLVGLDDSTLLRLHVAALQRARRARVTAIRDEIESLAAKLSDVLRADGLHAPSGTRPQSFGQVSGALFDEGRLGEELGARRGSRRLSAERRQRIEGALRVMKAHLARSDGPGVIVLHPGTVAPLVELPGAEVLEHAAALEVAQGLFDGLVAQWVELFRAVRLARLEVTGSYEPDRHEEGLAAFGAEALSPDELAAVPAVVVLETTRRIRGPLLSSLSDLMRSGRPIHVLVSDSPWDVEDGSARGWTMAVGYLAVAHREAFVVQSTLGRPRHLRDGIEAMARALRPGVAVVGAPGRGDLVPSAVQLAVAHEARATPCFVYDPDAGPSWADRLDLGGNSQPEEAWPAYDVPYRDADGNEADLTCRFTFADVAALDPELRDSFRVVPPEAWNDDQLEVADYLAAWERGEAADKLPFLWVVREDGALARAIVTRELAFAAHDRTGAWRTLQELGGIHNEWARRAAEAARATARAEAEREREALSERHEAERAEIRSSAAADALQRVAEVLLNLESAPASSNVGAAPTAAPMPAPDAPASPPVAKDASAAAETPAAEPEPAPEEEDEAPSFDEPYIDTPLCTTCNECTNLNPRLFKYDDNKQAYIADPGAGTYAELVQAAEKCPALCIHPGAPREGDSTATPDVVARAEPFR
ncbi:MAG: ferredoxin, partial [Myxococcota bacterium]